jgi:hypothetical protein
VQDISKKVPTIEFCILLGRSAAALRGLRLEERPCGP